MRKYLLVAGLLCVFFVASVHAASVKIAVFPSNDPAKLDRVMSVLSQYLSDTTGDEVTAVVTRDYAELAERLKNHTVDIAWINTLNYVKIKDEIPDIKYIATYMEKNEDTGEIMPYYQSYIVSLKAGGLKTLEDIKGKLFSFTDTGSTSGYAYPSLLLKKNGIQPKEYFKKVFFLKKHDRVIEALLKGSIDAGAVSDGTYFTAVRKNGDLFTIIAKSDPIPLDAIVAHENIPDSLVERYQKAFIAMPSDHLFCKEMRRILGWSAAGFEVRGDDFYDTVREALKQ